MSCNKFKIPNMNKPWMNIFAFETTNMSQGKLKLPANKEPLVKSGTTSFAVDSCSCSQRFLSGDSGFPLPKERL